MFGGRTTPHSHQREKQRTIISSEGNETLLWKWLHVYIYPLQRLIGPISPLMFAIGCVRQIPTVIICLSIFVIMVGVLHMLYAIHCHL